MSNGVHIFPGKGPEPKPKPKDFLLDFLLPIVALPVFIVFGAFILWNVWPLFAAIIGFFIGIIMLVIVGPGLLVAGAINSATGMSLHVLLGIAIVAVVLALIGNLSR